MSETPPSSKPSYGSASRMAQIIHWLHHSPLGIPLKDIVERLRISERTLARYLSTMKETLLDSDAEPLVETTRGSQGTVLRFRRKRFDMEGTAYELMSLYLALDLMNFLDGTMFHAGTQIVLERLEEALLASHGKSVAQGHQANLMLKDFNKKFYHWAEAPKDYSGHNKILETIVQSLILQRTVTMRYASPGKPAKTHEIEPLSLLMFKRALYLVGRKKTDNEEHPYQELTFAVERIRKITLEDESFAYPPEYEPQHRFQSSFGLVAETTPVPIVLAFDSLVAANVESRLWHHSQHTYREDDDTLVLEMTTEIGVELMSWILSYGAFVKVRAPQKLADMIVSRLEAALDSYKTQAKSETKIVENQEE